MTIEGGERPLTPEWERVSLLALPGVELTEQIVTVTPLPTCAGTKTAVLVETPSRAEGVIGFFHIRELRRDDRPRPLR